MISNTLVRIDTYGVDQWRPRDRHGRGLFLNLYGWTLHDPSTMLRDDRDGYPIIYGCRESFERRFTNGDNWIGFHRGKINIKLADAAWTKMEEKLGLKTPSFFYKAKCPSYKGQFIVVNLNPFWTHDILARSMCTMMLRYACEYYNGSTLESLMSYPLTAATLPVIKRYFDGYTEWVTKQISLDRHAGRVHTVIRPSNFYDHFSKQTDKQIEAQLRKPKKKHE